MVSLPDSDHIVSSRVWNTKFNLVSKPSCAFSKFQVIGNYGVGKPYPLTLTKLVLLDWYHPAKSCCAYLPGINISFNKECLHNCNLSNSIEIVSPSDVLISFNTTNDMGMDFALSSVMLRRTVFSRWVYLLPSIGSLFLWTKRSSYFSLDLQLHPFRHCLAAIFLFLF